MSRLPTVVGRELGIVYRCLTKHLIKTAGSSRKRAQSGLSRWTLLPSWRRLRGFAYLAKIIDGVKFFNVEEVPQLDKAAA